MESVTNTANMQQRTTELDWTTLPRTIQDAVTVAISLGYSHLWVDCLCIIQDDKQDWEKECPRMAHIYANADVTIAAVSAADSNAGFLEERENMRSTNKCIVKYRNGQGIHTDEVVVEYQEVDQLAPGYINVLDFRGWTLQERLLSTRILSFSKHKMYWECNQFRRLESLHGVLFRDDNGFRSVKRNLTILDSSQIYRWWYDILEDYCHRDITYRMDMLPALSGIAALINQRTGSTYLAGLWQADSASGLAWQSRYRKTDHEQQQTQVSYRAPSWSWAQSDYGQAKTTFPVVHKPNVATEGYVEFISAKINLQGADPFGQVAPGTTIYIRAPTKSGYMGKDFGIARGKFTDFSRVVIRLPYNTTGATALPVSIDSPKFFFQFFDSPNLACEQWSVKFQGVSVTTIRLCDIRAKKYGRWSYGLVLMATADPGVFRRVGLLASDFGPPRDEDKAVENWFRDAEVQSITLVWVYRPTKRFENYDGLDT